MSSPKNKTYDGGRAASRPPTSRRVRRLDIGLPFKRRLIIALRKFHTNKNRRSRLRRQLVLAVNLFTVREICLYIEFRERRYHREKGRLAPRPIRLRTAAAVFLIMLGISSSIFFGLNLHRPVNFSPTTTSKVLAAPKAAAKVMAASVPVRLQIPKIGVDTQLSQVGLQADGQMQMPWDITIAAWYKYSPTPGQLGPAVIVGHLDGANYINMAGVFYRLHELVPGDQIVISRADGSVAEFKVLYFKQVPQNDFPTQAIYGNINYAGIRLITCGGTFNSNINHYTDNTVVFGALE